MKLDYKTLRLRAGKFVLKAIQTSILMSEYRNTGQAEVSLTFVLTIVTRKKHDMKRRSFLAAKIFVK